MDTDDLTIKTIRAGPACTLVVSGELCYSSASGFLHHAARVVDDRTGRLVLDLAGVTFLDCYGLRALAIATSFAPGDCPVIMRSLSPAVHRILDLLDLDPENIRELNTDAGPCPCRKPHPCSSCCVLVLMKNSAKPVTSSYLKAGDLARYR